MDNQTRAQWADSALSAFATECGMRDAGEDDETIMGDLLADLRHLADARGIDFDKLMRRANMNYEAEIQEEAEGHD
ncbi:MAG: hypothetical protein E5W82_10590 [Mesorhizobium sp.]|nr:MAG: hypothetical protein E5W82_10590 [Mesorhizobium sp.]